MISLLLAAAIVAAGGGDLAAVREAENRWSAAFVTGDAGFLQQLLAEDYVSVGADGADHPKTMVIAAAGRYAAAHPGATATGLPDSSTIAISADLALVRHHSERDTSVDVFQKRQGRWVAIFSQHTALKPPA